MVVEIEVAVGVNQIFEVDAFGDDFIVCQTGQVDSVAEAVELGRVFAPGTLRGVNEKS